jgi:tetratricopeptide (TPR) repeat protein
MPVRLRVRPRGDEEDFPVEADALVAQGYEARKAARSIEARQHFSRAVEASRATGDPVTLAKALIGLAQIERDLSNIDAARRNYEEASTIVRTLDDPLWLAHTVRHVADSHRENERFDEAAARYEEALTIYRATVETAPLDLANVIRGYAILKERLGDRVTATELWQEAGDLYAAVDVQAGVEESKRRLATLR